MLKAIDIVKWVNKKSHSHLQPEWHRTTLAEGGCGYQCVESPLDTGKEAAPWTETQSVDKGHLESLKSTCEEKKKKTAEKELIWRVLTFSAFGYTCVNNHI